MGRRAKKPESGTEEFILGWRLNRRRLLKIAAAGTAVAAAPGPVRGILLPEQDRLWNLFLGSGTAEATAASFTATLFRPEDQLRLTFEFVNCSLASNTVTPTGSPSLMRVIFGSQHTVEHAIAAGGVPSGGAQDSLGARPTRVVFEIGGAIPFTTSSLLDFAAYALHIDPRADPGIAGGGSADPDEDVTAIEAPAGLVLSPGPSGRFTSEDQPITHSGITEVWRARLGTQSGATFTPASKDDPADVRAIFNSMPVDHFNSPTTTEQRDNLVTAMTNDANPATDAMRLNLTPVGAELDLSGAWDTGTIQAWVQRAFTGRDIIVRITERGRLAPFGHKASIITVSERKYLLDASGEVEAKLVETSFLSIKPPGRVEYPNTYMPNGGRGMPFVAVDAIDPGQIPVGKLKVSYNDGSGLQEADIDKAWRVTRDDFGALDIAFTAVDRLGNEVSFAHEVIFIAEEHAFAMVFNSPVGKVRGWYQASQTAAIREFDFNNQPVGYADETEEGNARTQKVTDKIRFTLEEPVNGATKPLLIAADWPAFFPKVEYTWIRDEAIDALSGASGQSATEAVVGGPASLQAFYASSWLTSGTGPANTGMRYLDLVTPVDLSVGGATRSMVQPDLNVSTFSLAYGAGEPPAATWNPATAMNTDAKILGVFRIVDLVGTVDAFGTTPDGGTEKEPKPGVPKFEVELIPGDPPLSLPVGTLFRFTWTPPLRSIKVGGDYLFVVAEDLDDADLPRLVKAPTEAEVVVEHSVFFDGSEATDDLDILVRRFAVQLPPVEPVIALIFEKLRYHKPPDGDDDMDLDLAGVRLVGQLNWMDPLQEFLEALGVEAGVEIRNSTVFAWVEIPVPTISFGVITILGFDVRLDLVLPLEGENPPLTTLSIGTRDNPIGIVVLCIPGGAFFALTVSPDGIEKVEMEIFFGLELEIKVLGTGVALGFQVGMGLEFTPPDEVLLTAFARLWGVLSVLGFDIVSTRAEALLEYNLNTRKLRGFCSFVLDMGIFGETEETAEVIVDLKNAGGGAPPLPGASASTGHDFPDRFSRNQWTEYCEAFVA
jgi:hypothetical protein